MLPSFDSDDFSPNNHHHIPRRSHVDSPASILKLDAEHLHYYYRQSGPLSFSLIVEWIAQCHWPPCRFRNWHSKRVVVVVVFRVA